MSGTGWPRRHGRLAERLLPSRTQVIQASPGKTKQKYFSKIVGSITLRPHKASQQKEQKPLAKGEHEEVHDGQNGCTEAGAQDDGDLDGPDNAEDTIYKEAFGKLSVKDREDLGLKRSGDGLRASIETSMILYGLCYGSTVRWTFRGRTVYLRDITDRICIALKQAKPIGEALVGMDEVHLKLPWQCISMLLDVAVKSKEYREALAGSLELALYHSRRLGEYACFLAEMETCRAAVNMRESLVNMNLSILTFLASIVRKFRPNPVLRTIQASWSLDDLEQFDQDLETLAGKIERDASNCDRELWLTFRSSIRAVHLRLHGITEDAMLGRLEAAAIKDAVHNLYDEAERSRCLAGTRESLLDEVEQWEVGGTGAFWLCGQAGGGKSTIARTVADTLDKSGKVAVSFFFSKASQANTIERQRLNAITFIPTIVWQLCQQIRSLRPYVAAALEEDPMLTGKIPSVQYEKLLQEPFRICGLSTGNIFIIVDAIDECQANFEGFVKIIQRMNDIRLFLTSRPEHHILQSLNFQRHALEDVPPAVVKHDIQLFIADQLRDQDLDSDAVQTLTDLTTPSFIIAATFCKYLCEGDAHAKLDRLLHKHVIADLMTFYFTILDDIRQRLTLQGKIDFMNDYKDIVGPLVWLYSPLDSTALAELLGFSIDRVQGILQRLQSVLNIKGTILPHHITFYECIRHEPEPALPKGPQSYHINASTSNTALCLACLKLLSRTLKPDILEMKQPGVLRETVTATQLEKITPATRYACLNWTSHTPSKDQVCDFLSTQLLCWLEAMSWLGHLTTALAMLSDLAENIEFMDIRSIIDDCHRFLRQVLNISDKAPLQLYSSGLLFTSQTSFVAKCYGAFLEENSYFSRLPPGPVSWDQGLWSVPQYFSMASLSQDHSKIAAIDVDSTLRILDVKSGAELIQVELKSIKLIQQLGFADDSTIRILDKYYLVPEGHIITFDLQCATLHRRGYNCPGTFLKASEDIRYALVKDEKAVYLDDLEGHRLAIATSREKHGFVGAVSSRCTAIALDLPDCAIRLIENETGEILHTMHTDQTPIHSLYISPDSETLLIASGEPQNVQLVCLETLQCIYRVIVPETMLNARYVRSNEQPFAMSTAVAGTDTNLILVSGRAVMVYNTTAKTVRSYNLPDVSATAQLGRQVVLSPDGRHFICSTPTSQYTGATYFYDLSSSEGFSRSGCLSSIERHFDTVCIQAYSARGLLALSTSDELSIWDKSLNLVASFKLEVSLGSIIISPQALYVIGRRQERKFYLGSSVMFLYNISSETNRRIAYDYKITPIISSDDKLLAYTNERKVHVVDIITSEILHQFSVSSTDLYFTDQGLLVLNYDAVPNGTMKLNLYDASGKTLAARHDRIEECMTSEDQGVVAHLDGRDVMISSAPDPKDLYLNADGWICFAQRRLLWIPPAYRDDTYDHADVVIGNKIIIAHPTRGLMWFEVNQNCFDD